MFKVLIHNIVSERVFTKCNKFSLHFNKIGWEPSSEKCNFNFMRNLTKDVKPKRLKNYFLVF